MSRNNHNTIILYLFLTVVLICFSCNRQNVYSHYVSTPIEGWSCYDSVRFEMGPVIQGTVFHEELDLRTTSHYPYTHLSLVVRQQVLPGGPLRCDTVTFALTDNHGNTTGSGVTHQSYTMALTPVQLANGERLAVTISHNMKTENIPGITEVGITLHPYSVSSRIDSKEDKQ